MFRLSYIILACCLLAAGCAAKPDAPPPKDYQLEALQNEVRQVIQFIDNWSGYEQKFSSINSLEEYSSVKQKVLASPAYPRFTGKERLQSKISQFDAVVRRYETWVEDRADLLERINDFIANYQANQKQLFSRHARPLAVGPYRLVIDNSYYQLEPDDPDKAYASARYVGLSQLNIIAASRDQPLRLPSLKISGFVVEVKIGNGSSQKLLRPDGFTVNRQTRTSRSGSQVTRSQRQYLVSFSDEVQNRYEFSQAVDVINKDSDNGIRPGESMIWTYHFNRENFPVETVKTFQAIYPDRVFGKPLRLSIPLTAIQIPELPAALNPARN